MREGMQLHHAVILAVAQTLALQRALVLADSGCRQPEHLENRRADEAIIDAPPARHVVGDDTPLPICRACERQRPCLLRRTLDRHHGVAHGIDIGHARLHALVHEDVAALAERDAARLQEARVGADADGEHDEVRRYLASARKAHENALRRLLERLHAVAKHQPDAVLVHLLLRDLRHVRVKRRQHMRRGLDERDGQTSPAKVFRHLDADEATAHDDGASRLRMKIRQPAQSFSVGHAAKRENARTVDAGNRRAQRLRAGRQQQRVIRLVIALLPRRLHMDDALCRVDMRDRTLRAHVDGEALAKQLGRHEQETLALLDLVAHIVGQAAVRKRNMLAAFEEDDLRLLIQPSQTRRRRRASRHAADDDVALRLLLLTHSRFHIDAAFLLPPSRPLAVGARLSPYRDNPCPCKTTLRAAAPPPGSSSDRRLPARSSRPR